MKYLHLYSTIIVLIIATGCFRDFDHTISDSVFIEDKHNPGLPIYSEKGYNSFGVYWGLSPFTTRYSHVPSKIVVKEDSCHLHLSGSAGSESYTLIISLAGHSPDSFSKLTYLENSQFDLSKGGSKVALIHNNTPLDINILEGEFKITRARKLLVDKELKAVVLCGTFSFKAIIDQEAVTFSNGRFDMQFRNDNFFKL